MLSTYFGGSNPCEIPPRNSMDFHGTSMECPWSICGVFMEFHGVPWNAMEFHRVPGNAMEFHGLSFEFHGLGVSVEFHGVPLSIDEV